MMYTEVNSAWKSFVNKRALIEIINFKKEKNEVIN